MPGRFPCQAVPMTGRFLRQAKPPADSATDFSVCGGAKGKSVREKKPRTSEEFFSVSVHPRTRAPEPARASKSRQKYAVVA